MCENDAVLSEDFEVNISQYDVGPTLRRCLQRHLSSRAFTIVAELLSESIAECELGKSLRRVHR